MSRIPGTNTGTLGRMRRVPDWNQFEKNKVVAAIWWWQQWTEAYPRLVSG